MSTESMEKLGLAAVPGAFLVDLFPFLRYIPEWFPGAGWKNTARVWAAELSEVVNKPYAFVQHQMLQGAHRPSFLSKLLEDNVGSTPEDTDVNKWSAGSFFSAGADTTVSSISYFFLAMTVFPEVQLKAQEEIDRVIGNDRLPTATDRENLPFIETMGKEVLRWEPVTPMGVPHRTTEDDISNGYFIPKDAMIMANVWHFTHNLKVYSNPMGFQPERFLKTETHEPDPDPRAYVFGFGRRVCSGRLLAENDLFLVIAQTLATFRINKFIEDGKTVEPVVKVDPGLVSHPAPWKFDIKPRSGGHEQLVKGILDKYPWRESDAKVLENMTI